MPLRTADELSYLTELRCDDAIHIWLAGIDKDTGIWHQKPSQEKAQEIQNGFDKYTEEERTKKKTSKKRVATKQSASKHRTAELAVVRDRHDRDNVLHGRARVTFPVYSKYETSIRGQSIEDIRIPPEHPEGGCLDNMTPLYNNFQ